METKATYEARAEECLRLADLTKDDLIQTTLLRLRQTYLRTAARLRAVEEGEAPP
jgi:hypothetical protein